jgi:hypothetical protein
LTPAQSYTSALAQTPSLSGPKSIPSAAKLSAPQFKLKVIFVTGAAGRSGTTLVARLLGEIAGCVNIGEAQYLFDRKTRVGDPPCGCGSLVAACPFWKEIEQAVPREVQDYAGRWVRTRRSPLLLMSYRRGPLSRGYREFLSTLRRTYADIARRADCRAIIDTTKSPWYLLALSQLLDVEVNVLHLVRSPAAVVTSWSRQKNYTPPQPAWRVLAEWSLHNALFEALGGRAHRYWRIRFEDLIGAPQSILEPIASEILGRSVALPFVAPNRARVGVQHILVSNADKLAGGEITIRPETQRAIPWQKKILVDLLTFPLLWRYGYFS